MSYNIMMISIYITVVSVLAGPKSIDRHQFISDRCKHPVKMVTPSHIGLPNYPYGHLIYGTSWPGRSFRFSYKIKNGMRQKAIKYYRSELEAIGWKTSGIKIEYSHILKSTVYSANFHSSAEKYSILVISYYYHHQSTILGIETLPNDPH